MPRGDDLGRPVGLIVALASPVEPQLVERASHSLGIAVPAQREIRRVIPFVDRAAAEDLRDESVQCSELVGVDATEPVPCLGDFDGAGGIGLYPVLPRADPAARHLQCRRERARTTVGIPRGDVEVLLVVFDSLPGIGAILDGVGPGKRFRGESSSCRMTLDTCYIHNSYDPILHI